MTPEAVAAARHLGLLPMLAAAIGSVDDPERFWEVASLTDPITASSIQQGCAVGGRNVLFVEKGAAECLARGKAEVVVAEEGRRRHQSKQGSNSNGHTMGGTRSAVLGILDPIRAVMRGVWKTKAGNDLVKTSDELEGDKSPRASQSRQDKISNSNGRDCTTQDMHVDNETNAPSQMYRLKEIPSHSSRSRVGDPPSAWHAHLAHVPVRLALALLRGMPRQFALFSAGSGPDGATNTLTNNNNAPQQQQREYLEHTLFSAADRIDDVIVHTIRGASIVQGSMHGPVHFTPAFLSKVALQRIWRNFKDEYGSSILMMRQAERAVLCSRLVQALALAGGGAGSPPGSFGNGASSSVGLDDDDDDDGPEEPPEVQEILREMGAANLNSLAGESGGIGFDGADGGGRGPRK